MSDARRTVEGEGSMKELVTIITTHLNLESFQLQCDGCEKMIDIGNDELTTFRSTGHSKNLRSGKSPFLCRSCQGKQWTLRFCFEDVQCVQCKTNLGFASFEEYRSSLERCRSKYGPSPSHEILCEKCDAIVDGIAVERWTIFWRWLKDEWEQRQYARNKGTGGGR